MGSGDGLVLLDHGCLQRRRNMAKSSLGTSSGAWAGTVLLGSVRSIGMSETWKSILG